MKACKTKLLFVILTLLINGTSFTQPSKEIRETAQKIKASGINEITVTKFEYKFGKPEEEGTLTKYIKFNDEGYPILEIRYKSGEDEFRNEEYKYRFSKKEMDIITYNADDYILKKVTEKYNSFGDIEQMLEYEATGYLKYKTIYEYKSQGKLSKITKYTKDGNVLKITEFVYDAGDRLQEKIYKSDEKTVLNKTTYAYDAAGNMIEEANYNSSGKLEGKYIFKYDGSNKIEEIKQDSDGKTVYRVEYKYDASGNRTEKTLFESDGVTVSMRVNYKYDKNGNLKEEVESNKLGEKKKLIVYEFN